MMGPFWRGSMGGFGGVLGLLACLLFLAFVALVVWLIVRLVRGTGPTGEGRTATFTPPTGPAPHVGPAPQVDPALETLRRRLAEGAITPEEFDRLREKLGV